MTTNKNETTTTTMAACGGTVPVLVPVLVVPDTQKTTTSCNGIKNNDNNNNDNNIEDSSNTRTKWGRWRVGVLLSLVCVVVTNNLSTSMFVTQTRYVPTDNLSTTTTTSQEHNNNDITPLTIVSPNPREHVWSKGGTTTDNHHHQEEREWLQQSPVCRPHLIHYNNNNINNNNSTNSFLTNKNNTNTGGGDHHHHLGVKIRRIFFGHMRKAGGSTIRAYLTRVAKKYQLKLFIAEATKFEIPNKRADTIYITHLRDPVTRILSQYKYEGRWSCNSLVHNESQFIPTQENSIKLSDWMASDEQNGTCSTERHKRIGWKCASNCYIRWLNFPHGFCAMPQDLIPGTPLYQRAWDRAHQYNIIIHIERLATDDSYRQGIEQLFGVHGGLRGQQNMWCSKQSKRANEIVPLDMSNETLQQDLYERNWPDYTLYDKLVACPNGIEFPDEGALLLSDLVV